MNNRPNKKPSQKRSTMFEQVDNQAQRKLKARHHSTKVIWFGLGMMGLIGWSVVVPTLLGAALGIWLDEHYPGSRSWTLALLMAGLALGCINAWLWVDKEDKAMHARKSDDE